MVVVPGHVNAVKSAQPHVIAFRVEHDNAVAQPEELGDQPGGIGFAPLGDAGDQDVQLRGRDHGGRPGGGGAQPDLPAPRMHPFPARHHRAAQQRGDRAPVRVVEHDVGLGLERGHGVAYGHSELLPADGPRRPEVFRH